jgi:hypothetical protein
MLGLEFLKWLNEKLASGTIVINRAPLLAVPGGLLMSVESFRWFMQESSEFKNATALQKAFQSLGLHQTAADGGVLSHFEQTGGEPMQSGFFLSDYAVILPERVSIQTSSQGDVATVSAMELVQMLHANGGLQQAVRALHLSTTGTWEPPTDVAPIFSPGVSPRG